MSNPFCPPGSPLPTKLLVGRDTEIAIAFDSINKCSHLAIYGSSGIGKSVFLKYLESAEVWQQRGLDHTKALIVLINCQGIYPFSPSQFWREVLTLLKEQVSQESSLLATIDLLLAKEVIQTKELRSILQKIGEQKQFLLLLLDDYDTVLQSNEIYPEPEMIGFLREFRDLAVHRREGRYL